ncbi:5915_t:CDS:2, partial [Acaulospora morrowiae]
MAGVIVDVISIVDIVFREICELSEKAGHNKKVCRRLTERIRVATKNLRNIRIEENDTALKNYIKALEDAKDFIKDISEASTLMRLIKARKIETDYKDVTEELDNAIAQLGLNQCTRTQQNIEEDLKLFHSEIKTSLSVIEEVNKHVWEKGMNIEEKVDRIEKKLDCINQANNSVYKEGEMSSNLENSKIPDSRISHCEESDEEITRGGGQIVKKTLCGVYTVAQKEIGHIGSLPRPSNVIEKQVAILTELKSCENIITFYGTVQRSGKLYIISEWAEEGDLCQYLKRNKNLDWNFKYRIASEIASGLAFCHFYNILHHDIRSHNILLTARKTAKLSNFNSARKETDESTQVKDITHRYRWLAPEKLSDHNSEYTKQCDIYSFGIVLWELASQQEPFADVTVAKELIEKVSVNKERPPNVPDTNPTYQKMMNDAWHPKALKRPTADNIFKELNKLANNRPFES